MRWGVRHKPTYVFVFFCQVVNSEELSGSYSSPRDMGCGFRYFRVLLTATVPLDTDAPGCIVVRGATGPVEGDEIVVGKTNRVLRQYYPKGDLDGET